MPGQVSKDVIEQIRAASDIVDVIGSYLPLKRAGANWTALCPFHKEKTPSFNVNPRLQIFHCFGCHQGGDVFRFVQEYENIPFPDALKRLAERAHIPLEFETSPEARAQRGLRDILLTIHEQLTQRWNAALTNGEEGRIARDHLAKRGVSDEAIKLFRLGYAPAAWEDTVNWSRSKGFNLADMEKAGLIIRKEGRDPYGRFRGRLMFPICDDQGRVVAFSGRVLMGDEKQAKYVNSPETPIFTKSRIFYGLDKSKRALLDAGHALVCEGQLDLIACFMAGIENVVAPQGTAFTSDHARILKRYVEEVVLCFDSDAAGQDAATRSIDALLGAELAVRVAIVPSPHDPDSFIRAEGVDAFRELIDKAPGFFDFLLNRLCQQNDPQTDRGRLAVLRGMADALWKTGNRVLIDSHARKTALRLGASPDSVRAEFERLGRSLRQTRSPEEIADSEEGEAQPAPPNPMESWILKFLIRHEELLPWAAEHLDCDWIQHPAVREILAARLTRNLSVAALLEECSHPQAAGLITEAAAAERDIPNPAEQIETLTERVRNLALDREMADLIRQIGQPDVSDEQKLLLLKRQQEIRVEKRQPLSGPQP